MPAPAVGEAGAPADAAGGHWQAQLLEQVNIMGVAIQSMQGYMLEGHLSGADAARHLYSILKNWDPLLNLDSFCPVDCHRLILGIQAFWRHSSRIRGLRPTEEWWSLIVESCYCRALAEQHGEDMVQKIDCWRQTIPEARGASWRTQNFLELQRQLQMGPNAVVQLEPNEVLHGDLLAWTTYDLRLWRRQHPHVGPTASFMDCRHIPELRARLQEANAAMVTLCEGPPAGAVSESENGF